MRHVPHLLVPGPWGDCVMTLTGDQLHHLRTVLRFADGAALSYTDGAGSIGSGTLDGERIRRGAERVVALPRPVTVAVAPPESKDRLRFLVEKAAELGAARVRWLETRHGQGRPPRGDRAQQWADMALEQSRGAFRTIVDDAPCGLDELTGIVLVADPAGGAEMGGTEPVTVAIGPEGGWAPGEIPESWPRVGLGDRVLRVETAAVVALARLIVR